MRVVDVDTTRTSESCVSTVLVVLMKVHVRTHGLLLVVLESSTSTSTSNQARPYYTVDTGVISLYYQYGIQLIAHSSTPSPL